MHILQAWRHIHTTNEVSMTNPVPQAVARRGVHRQHRQHTTDKACLYKALWLINQIIQKDQPESKSMTSVSDFRYIH